jgi:hypothetical protein
LAAFEQRPESETGVKALRSAYEVTSVVADEDRARVILIGRILSSSPALRMASYGRHRRRTAHGGGHGPDGGETQDRRARVIVAAMSAVATAEWHPWIDEDGPGDPSERIVAALEALDQGLSAVESGRSLGGGR